MFTKIVIQILAVLIVADIAWLWIMIPHWSHDNKTKNEYWDNLSTIHTVVIILAFAELIVKGLTLAYLVFDFKTKNPDELRNYFKFNLS